MKHQEEVTLPCGGSPAPSARTPRRVHAPLRALLGAALACLGTVAGCSDAKQADGPKAVSVVDTVDLAGLERSLAAQRGHAVLLNFWATWCPPCVEEMPDLVEVARKYEGRGARVLLVSYDGQLSDGPPAEIEADVRAFLAKRDWGLPVHVAAHESVKAIEERYALPGPIPVTLAFDKDGKLVDREDGPSEPERFEALMKKALGE